MLEINIENKVVSRLIIDREKFSDINKKFLLIGLFIITPIVPQ